MHGLVDFDNFTSEIPSYNICAGTWNTWEKIFHFYCRIFASEHIKLLSAYVRRGGRQNSSYMMMRSCLLWAYKMRVPLRSVHDTRANDIFISPFQLSLRKGGKIRRKNLAHVTSNVLTWWVHWIINIPEGKRRRKKIKRLFAFCERES